jgi:hypothetical protein
VAAPTAVVTQADAPANASKATDVPAEVRQANTADRVVDRRPAPQLTTEELRADARVAGGQPEVPAAPPALGAGAAAGGSAAPADPSAGLARSRRDVQAGADRPAVGQQRITMGPVGDLRLSGAGVEAPQPAAPLPATPQTTAERVLSRPAVPPVSVPGLALLSAEWRAVGGDAGMLVRQRTENGAEVQIRLIGDWLDEATAPPSLSLDEVVATGGAGAARQRAEAPATSALPEHIANLERTLSPGWRQVIRQYRGGWVVAQGPLSVSALGSLLDAAGVP